VRSKREALGQRPDSCTASGGRRSAGPWPRAGEHVGGVAAARRARTRPGWRAAARPRACPGARARRGGGRGRCRWPRTGRRGARPARHSRRLRRRSRRAKGRWSSPGGGRGPKAATRRRPAAAASACASRSTRPARAPSRAQPLRQTSPSAWASTTSSRRAARPARGRAVAGVRVGAGEDPAQVPVARPRPRTGA
jgi:hypothetical protein